MKVALLYPLRDGRDALANWARALARHCKHHEVRLSDGRDVGAGDTVFLITQGENYPRALMDTAIAELTSLQIPFGVVHNEDNPGVPTPGEYPSFCWTERAKQNLAAYRPVLARQPVLPPCVVYSPMPLYVSTFGIIEDKKQTRAMAHWCKQHDIPFTAFGPEALAAPYAGYLGDLERDGARYVLYPWQDHVEGLAPLFYRTSHFLFVLPQSKGGTGGSPTSPRYASAFCRPVVVIDDERTFEQDGYYVSPSLDELKPAALENMAPPWYHWTPDAYVDRLVAETREWWGGRR